MSLQSFLLSCLLINFVILIVWFAAFTLAHEFMYNRHSRWFKLTREQFDAIHYCGMAVYKVLILVFNVVPLLALLLSSGS